MPKMKTHKASKKRFRVTGTGKLKRSKAGKRHLISAQDRQAEAAAPRPEIVTGKLDRQEVRARDGHHVGDVL